MHGVSISITVNENNLFEKTNKAKLETNRGVIKEEIEFAVLNSRFEEENLGRITESQLEDNLLKIDVEILEREEDEETPSTLPWKVTKGGFMYTIDEVGNVRFDSNNDNPAPDNPDQDNPEETDETTEAEAVASSEENGVKKYYKTIESAISNIQQEGIVELLENSEVTSMLQIKDTQKIELKTNGKVLSSTTTNVLRNAGDLTINGAGIISTTGENAYAITNVGTLKANSVTINSTYRGIYNTGKTSLNNSTVSVGDIAIRNLENGIINVNSGAILQATTTGETVSYGIYSTSTNENAVIVNGGKIISNSDKGTAFRNKKYCNRKSTINRWSNNRGNIFKWCCTRCS